jgi:hypothetical protein
MRGKIRRLEEELQGLRELRRLWEAGELPEPGEPPSARTSTTPRAGTPAPQLPTGLPGKTKAAFNRRQWTSRFGVRTLDILESVMPSAAPPLAEAADSTGYLQWSVFCMNTVMPILRNPDFRMMCFREAFEGNQALISPLLWDLATKYGGLDLTQFLALVGELACDYDYACIAYPAVQALVPDIFGSPNGCAMVIMVLATLDYLRVPRPGVYERRYPNQSFEELRRPADPDGVTPHEPN